MERCLMMGSLVRLSHHFTRSNQTTKAFLMGKSVARTHTSPTTTAAERPELFFGSDFGKTLKESHFVSKCWMNVRTVKAPGHHRKQKYNRCQKTGEPKGRIGHGISEGSNIIAEDNIVVEELEGKIENQAPPNGHMVQPSPVGSVQGHLGCNDKNKGRGHH